VIAIRSGAARAITVIERKPRSRYTRMCSCGPSCEALRTLASSPYKEKARLTRASKLSGWAVEARFGLRPRLRRDRVN
jgi:hypothetical protein